ncbi:MarR family winged helix-turn-helix transcriptional regulator [Massilia sp. CMS3.1]|uniref:MarR family winged helix-turn-helix transcriptional regulator n=1 Tax=Massilia sp. CMS3.1 TaxID=3373083 RepID=UPI003EE5B062
MSDFGPTGKRLRNIQARVPGFPFEPILLVRLSYHLQKRLRDRTNAALKPYELADTGYIVLAILYGSAQETSTASELSEACHEKPANLTRVCDDLVARGLIERGTRAGDRRNVLISLSGKGRELIEQVLPDVSGKLSAAYAGFSKAELEQFAGLLARVLGNLDKAV